MSKKTKKPRKTIIFSVYLYRRCPRAHQDGVLNMREPSNQNRELQFDHLDEIPRKIRQHLETVGLTYDVDEDSDDTVITEKKRKRTVIKKIRRGDPHD